jgi:S1-C subfamily serine protease
MQIPYHLPHPSRNERLRRAARHPLIGGLLGALVVMAVAIPLISFGAIGTERKTSVVQSSSSSSRPVASGPSGLTVSDIYKRDGAGVAFVRAEIVQKGQTPLGLSQSQRQEATGSGFVIDAGGDILTNAHVVEGATKVTVQLGGKTMNAKVAGRDASSDIALLRVQAPKGGLHPLALGDSDTARVGDPVVAIGNPFGLDRTVTSGIVSAVQRQIKAPNGSTINHAIQTDAPVNPGNSGGPLIDSQGRVIGITSQIETAGSGGSVGIGFAVPINTAKKIAEQLGAAAGSGLGA